jgi:murein DD-endopeptidase MepM/ murein hydrolase activator NlpD
MDSNTSPKSKRNFDTSDLWFRSKGKNKINRTLNDLGSFVHTLGNYTVRKFRQILWFFGGSVGYSYKFSLKSKDFVVKKLIWSRGKLGRPFANLVVMVSALIVFLFGEVFNSSPLVNSQEIDSDYLTNVTDIIPKKNTVATTLPDSRKRAESFTYTVESGDTLSGIGNKFKISVDALKYVNGLSDNSYLKVGQEIVVPPVSGLVHEVDSGDTLASIATKYDVAPQAIADFNYILDTSKLAVGTELVIPGAKVPQPVVPAYVPPTISTSFGVPTANKGYCVWPSTARIITQYFTWYHNGIDVATPWGSMPPLFACTSGTVIRAGWDPWGLGLHVQIDHGDGYQTVYGHMSRIDVSYGQRVSRGQVIGLMGSTGRSTGPHVHYMVKYNGVAQDPLKYTQ